MAISSNKHLESALHSFENFEKAFPYQGDSLYALIFERHRDKIKINKEKFAVRNLRNIFESTFCLVPKTGFAAMSLRDLSTETGLSMGGLYSSISSKENILLIVKDVVTLVCEEVVAISRKQVTPLLSLQALVLGNIYASTLLQPWFYFLYFETRSLPQEEQEGAKNLEIGLVQEMQGLIAKVSDSDECGSPELVATMALSMVQERYLKPWKYKKFTATVDDYAEQCLQLIYRTLCLQYQ